MKTQAFFKRWFALTAIGVLAGCSVKGQQINLTFSSANSNPDDGNTYFISGQTVGEGIYAFELTGLDFIPYVGVSNMPGALLTLFDFPDGKLSDGSSFQNPFSSGSMPSGWQRSDQYASTLTFRFFNESGAVNGIFDVVASSFMSGTVNWSFYDEFDNVFASGTAVIPAPEPSALEIFLALLTGLLIFHFGRTPICNAACVRNRWSCVKNLINPAKRFSCRHFF